MKLVILLILKAYYCLLKQQRERPPEDEVAYISNKTCAPGFERFTMCVTVSVVPAESALLE